MKQYTDIILTDNELNMFRGKNISNETLIEIKDYFTGAFPKTKWYDLLYDNPYKLSLFKGFGFKRADIVAHKIGFDMKSPLRIVSSVSYALEKLSTGDTIIPITDCLEYISKLIELDYKTIIPHILNFKITSDYILLKENFKKADNVSEVKYVTTSEWYNTEKEYYTIIKNSSKQDKLNLNYDIEELSNKLTLNYGQKQGLESILNNNVNILTGYGGSGKTYLVKAYLDILKNNNISFVCLTPTGIASKVFKQSTGYNCQTIHSRYYNECHIEEDVIVLDECSMLSVEHWNMILTMINNNYIPRFLFIGDINQLIPISAGCPFRDTFKLVESNKLNINIVKLTQIMRASSETFIPYLSKEFCDNNRYVDSHENETLNKVNFYPLSKNINLQLLDIMTKHKFNYDNTYILTPKNIGSYGTKVINEYMDNLYGEDILYQDNSKIIRRGSYCINIKNNARKNIFNGERLICIDGNKEYLTFKKLDENKTITYKIKEISKYISLSYALSVHKSQGMTIDNVIFIATMRDIFMLNRNLVYTALSRASKNLVILCEDDVMSISNSKYIIDNRKTFLSELSKIVV